VTPRRSDLELLVRAAQAARGNAHAPYSRYRVGAAILTQSRAIHSGCNVENASYGAALCAERAAVAAMVGAGDRKPVACAVVTRGPRPGAPCGICRQVLAEFAGDMVILLVAESDDGHITSRKRARLRTLLPQAFRLR
jgi:cytidine deaminase